MNAKRILLACVVAAIVAWLLLKINAARGPGAGAHSSASPAHGAISADVLQKVTASAALAKQSPTPSHPPGENAADIYKNAWVLFNALSDEEKNILSHPRQKVDADKADALFKKIQPIMDLLRHATNDATYCDWAMGPLTYNSSLPQLNLVQKLGMLAAWDASYLFPTDSSGALSDLAAQTQLGHSIGGQAVIGFLVEGSLNAVAIGLIKDNAATLSPDALSQAREMFNTSFAEQDFAQAMALEAELPRSIARALSNPQTREKTLDSLVGSTEGNDGKMRQEFEAQIQTIPAQAEWLAQVENDFVQKAQLPNAEFDAWWSQVSEDAKSKPLAAGALPALTSIRNRLRLGQVNQAMLAAGLAVLQSGPAQVASQPDPVTGQSFTYVQTAGGFELRSTFQNKGKPVTMSFPPPAQ